MQNESLGDLWGNDEGEAEDGSGVQPIGDANDQESRSTLQRALYLMYQHQPVMAYTLDELRERVAWMRYECQRLEVPIPGWLRDWHPDVECVPGDDGEFRFTYHDPDDSPNPPAPYPEAQPLPANAEDDMDRWERKSLKATRAGRRPSVAFASDTIPGPVQTYITKHLAEIHDADDIRALFADFVYDE